MTCRRVSPKRSRSISGADPRRSAATPSSGCGHFRPCSNLPALPGAVCWVLNSLPPSGGGPAQPRSPAQARLLGEACRSRSPGLNSAIDATRRRSALRPTTCLARVVVRALGEVSGRSTTVRLHPRSGRHPLATPHELLDQLPPPAGIVALAAPGSAPAPGGRWRGPMCDGEPRSWTFGISVPGHVTSERTSFG